MLVWKNIESGIGLEFDYARHLKLNFLIAFSLAFVVKLVEWPGKWGMVLFEAIERGDIKCSQISLFTYHCKILLTMVCLVLFLPKIKLQCLWSFHCI